ncbi:DNA topoisomerase I [Thermotomaculum hydrothermale]|uniref:DNA topoisomerase 1 n=1 Tax=Thermotomaculum hydrothermale TaxID=981385 RepID=A0A7R6SY55_9BACT|nr:type I DNA topoisomerase [Thermotomaculum hydrothermale]BBB32206.1 DNA topoisomerase I [Thermotomaculum hydrothermale]
MADKLIIVESPAKSRTIEKYLKGKYHVEATMGHIVDLPKKEFGIDIENGFKPKYVVIDEKKKVVSNLKKKAKNYSEIYLAADPDREGEAICYHLKNLLSSKDKKIYRVLFNEITPTGISKALESPGDVDLNKFNAQQTRRIVDRIVGYKVSPLLWEKVKRGLSAGRVQTVALRIICEREEEIRKFNKEEYWTILAELLKNEIPFTAKLVEIDGRKVRIGNKKAPIAIDSKQLAEQIKRELEKGNFLIESVKKKHKKRNPLPPFITSKLQQEAARVLDFPVKKTMRIAQKLYEGVDIGDGPVGLITYMRTDSTRISKEAIESARAFIGEKFGKEELPSKPNVYSAKENAQDAHEAIRPTSVFRTPESISKYLSKDELALYSLIWKRFVASQMTPAIFEETEVKIKNGKYTLEASGTVLKKEGFLKVYNPGVGKDKLLPEVEEGEKLALKNIEAKQNFTTPPPRYTEATLVKELESNGIGRPSTYATIISVIQNRAYVLMKEKKFYPTALGELVNKLLVSSFPKIFEINYTANLEKELDGIEEGKLDYLEVLRKFYIEFERYLKRAEEEMVSVKRNGVPIGEKCEKCGGEMVKKVGKFGVFIACSNYPECKNTREVVESADGEDANGEKKTCPKCGGELVLKSGRYGKFYTCSNYPECDYRESLNGNGNGVKQLDKNCPQCGKPLVERKGKYGKFIACSGYPECKYIEKEKPKELDIICPKCGKGKIVVRKTRRGKVFYGCSRYPDCDYASWTLPDNGEKSD